MKSPLAFRLLLVLLAFNSRPLLSDEPQPATDAVEYRSIFNGRSLAGWRCVPKANIRDWSVRKGVLVAKGSEDKLVYLVYEDENLADFELKLEYRMAKRGNTGVEIRAHVDKTGKRPFEGYHADVGHVGVGPHILGAWDFHFAKRQEHACPRGTKLVIKANGETHRSSIENAVTIGDIHRHEWNRLHIIAKGNALSFSINDKVASEFIDNVPERLRKGMVGLQIHDAGMIVEFRKIRLKRLPSRE